MLALSGASGLVGRYLCDELLDNGIPFKLLGRTFVDSPPFSSVPFCFYDLTCSPSDSLRSFLQDVDVLINLAALLPNIACSHLDYFSCNSVAPKLLFDLCSDLGIGKFIHLSGANILQPVDGLVSSNSNYSSTLRQPSYLSSKIAGELLLLNSSAVTDLYIVRPSSIYGYSVRSGLFRHLYDSLSQSKSVTLSHRGLWSADFIYAGDVAKCILGLLENVEPGVFNLGSGSVTTIHKVARMLVSLIGVKEDLIVLDPCSDDSALLGSLPAISCDQVFSLLGRQPFSLEEGLNHSISTYGTF